MGCCLVIDAVKEADTAGSLGIALGLVLFIDESGNTAYPGALFVTQKPTLAFSEFEGFVLLRVKYFCYIFIQGTDPIGILFVKICMYLYKQLGRFCVIYFDKLHKGAKIT